MQVVVVVVVVMEGKTKSMTKKGPSRLQVHESVGKLAGTSAGDYC